MAQDFSLPVRKVILTLLNRADAVRALVPRFYPSTVPAGVAFPFGRYGAAISAPFLAAGLDSSAITVALHGFTKGVSDGDRLLVSAEDHAHAIAATIGAAMDGQSLPLPGGYIARVNWTGSNILIDGDEPGAWHAVVNIRVEVSG